MSKNDEDTGFLDFLTPDAVAASDAALWAEMSVCEEKRGKTERKARQPRSRGTSGGRGRPPGTDTARSAQMIYRVVDTSTKTNWFVAGLGTTERMVKNLQDGGSKLQPFTETRSGDRMPVPQYYQLALNLTKKRGEPRIEWWPNKYTDKCHFVDNGTKLAGLYRVQHEPQIPGFVSVELVPTDERPGVRPVSVGLSGDGKWLALEYEHLRQEAHTGKLVVIHELGADQILGALEELLNITMTEDVKRKALANLAPVEEQDESHYPMWARDQNFPDHQLIEKPPVLTETGDGWLSTAYYPFTEMQLNTKHW